MRSFESELDGLRDHALHRSLRPLTSRRGTRVVLGARGLVNFSSNDYLGLAGSDLLSAALIDAVKKHGAGAGASRLICGNLPPHAELDRQIANFKRTEAAITFGSGYAAAVGTLTALAQKGDVVVLDKLCHASLVDGARLSGATIRVFPHNNTDKLKRLLKWGSERAGDQGRVLVVAESVYSMDGDWAELAEIVRLKEDSGALLLLDEAHAFGVFGSGGRGLADALGLAANVDLHLGTLSKAAGLSGGYICGRADAIDLILNRARSLIYSTAPPPAIAAAACDVVNRILPGSAGERRRTRLWENVRLFGDLMGDAIPPPASAIVPVILGESEAALRASAQLEDRGYLAPAIRYPTVARGRARLRVTFSADHTTDEIEGLAGELKRMLASTEE